MRLLLEIASLPSTTSSKQDPYASHAILHLASVIESLSYEEVKSRWTVHIFSSNDILFLQSTKDISLLLLA